MNSVDNIKGSKTPNRVTIYFKPYFFKLFFITITVALVSLIIATVMEYSLQTTETKSYVKKEAVTVRLKAIIKNGAHLDLVKHYYDVRPIVHPHPLKRIDVDEYYSYMTPLSVILNDICVDYLSSEPFKEDSLFFARLMHIIQENQYHNPYDSLEETQKLLFENVRLIIGNDYDLIQEDMVRIGSELSHKNQLVSKYLNRSNISFFISIGALVLTIVLSMFQIAQGHKINQQIKDLLAESKAQLKQDEKQIVTVEE